MKNYEDEVKKPITGLVFGNLITTMLIQVQCIYNSLYDVFSV